MIVDSPSHAREFSCTDDAINAGDDFSERYGFDYFWTPIDDGKFIVKIVDYDGYIVGFLGNNKKTLH